ncbi:TonB family protein [Aliifodinibius sp. S!AR15-10]|uniref:energy transducer TonB family protein n=1 Tax=Aliifodinibius sp. S!AR15-10 TaxID=2950437 RepID=UPI00285FFC82|nr:TonB family protein [Aliifodinibius sp. S!AR15-10]MDR8394222.1 TonB family protein [Aliifodinibius sp. S!AR15-10]
MILKKFDEEDRFAMAVTGGFHLLLVIFFLLYTFSINRNLRPSFIEVEFGEFSTGTQAEYSEQQAEEVATRPDPSETQPENPQPEQPQPVEEQETTTEETTKPVDAPDQQEEIQEEEIQTPETDKVEPQEEAAEEQQEEITVPPKTEQDETVQEGEETSGDTEGSEGDINADQGTGNETEKSSPYNLSFEGEIDRAPMVQPLPDNVADSEATITIRFEVKPDGTLGRIIPLKKMNAELEREVIRTLRSWRFSRLPSGVPQQNQWGTITFRFVLQ